MYVRFVTPLIPPDSRVETGFFRASWYLHRIGAPDWILRELYDEFEWFNEHLPVPGRVARHFKRRNSIWGVCWFDHDAREMIARAHYCAWLIEEGGLPVRAVRIDRHREVLWRDAHPVGVKPTFEAPRGFN